MPITEVQSSRLRYGHVVIAESLLSSHVQLIPLCVYLHFPSIVSERNQSIMHGTLGRDIGKTIKTVLIILKRSEVLIKNAGVIG